MTMTRIGPLAELLARYQAAMKHLTLNESQDITIGLLANSLATQALQFGKGQRAWDEMVRRSRRPLEVLREAGFTEDDVKLCVMHEVMLLCATTLETSPLVKEAVE